MWQAHSPLFPHFLANIDWPLPVLSGVILAQLVVKEPQLPVLIGFIYRSYNSCTWKAKESPIFKAALLLVLGVSSCLKK